MDIKAVSFKDFLKNKKDIYKNINVVAKRARQIIDSRYNKILSMQNIDDTEQLEEVVDTDYDKCVGCHICADVCPCGYIEMGMQY